jgi:class 3 adenylate cyclase
VRQGERVTARSRLSPGPELVVDSLGVDGTGIASQLGVVGIRVSIGARISALAGPGGVLVSNTVTDLVAGSGPRFEDRSEHQLEGIAEPWRQLVLLD